MTVAIPSPSAPVLFLPCAGGVESLLAEEVTRLLGPQAGVQERRGGVADLLL